MEGLFKMIFNVGLVLLASISCVRSQAHSMPRHSSDARPSDRLGSMPSDRSVPWIRPGDGAGSSDFNPGSIPNQFLHRLTTRRPRTDFEGALLSYMCQRRNGRICSGNGVCRNGMCRCYTGYLGPHCEMQEFDGYPTDATTTTEQPDTTTTPPSKPVMPCSSREGNDCGEHGSCLDGECYCDLAWSGKRCEMYHRGGFCRAYKQCAECKALMDDCPENCTVIADFKLVFGFKTGPTFHRCKERNDIRQCVFYYQLDREDQDGTKHIAVRACVPEGRTRSTTTTHAPPDVTEDDDDDNKVGQQDRSKGGPGDSAVSGHASNALLVATVILLSRA